MSNLVTIVSVLKKEQNRLTRELRGISAALAAFAKAYGQGSASRKRSRPARAKMSARKRPRPATIRATTEQQAKVVPIRRKRTLSAAGRRKIAAAQRARWARVRAAKKTA
jgi:hypothetical protein